MTLISILAGAALALILLAALLPWLARWGGVLLIIDSLGGLWLHLGHGPLISLMWLFGGIAAWMAGHLTYAYRDGVWRSWLALQIFRLPGLRAVRPETM
ncbi:hypothetical protein [Nocardia terpenica]|uniref:DUF4175 domain-containing protein n=1 Tax=Nocardia terpenica TaxID=455432 RepID=A0A6G9ZD97_9NOCA|nr:hypothetical protein [Nocardia terpenica]QIS23424.1 hypothetical protein F6W96_38985 [Nocardia terpenica]